jgi:hypothetical protein
MNWVNDFLIFLIRKMILYYFGEWDKYGKR